MQMDLAPARSQEQTLLPAALDVGGGLMSRAQQQCIVHCSHDFP